LTLNKKLFLTAASCPKKDFFVLLYNSFLYCILKKAGQKKLAERRQKGSKKGAKMFIPEPVLLLS